MVVDNNVTGSYGGGIALFHPKDQFNFTLKDSSFTNNKGGRVSRGGALHLTTETDKYSAGISVEESKLTIENTKFYNNMALEGGSIFQTASNSRSGRLTITNCDFFCCNNSFQATAKRSSFLMASFTTHMRQVNFSESPMSEYSLQTPGLILNNGGDSHHLSDLRYKCSKAKLEVKMPVTNNSEDSLLIYCARCTYLPYTAGDGTVKITNTSAYKSDHQLIILNHNVEITNPCRQCPFGGDCSEGDIKARPNYWGYEENGLKAFQSCPQGYCCNDINIPCEAYDTCALHREGRLCGKCKSGFSESLMSTTCISNEKCKDWWLWPVGMFLALLYLIWYMYKGEIMVAFEILIIKLSSISLQTIGINVTRRESLQETGKMEPEDPGKSHCGNQGPHNKADKGYFDILVYFVNIISLLKVEVEFQSSGPGNGFLSNVDKYFTSYLDVDIQRVGNVTLCPFRGTDALIKYLAKPGFVVVILLIWLLLYTMTSVVMPLLIFSTKKTSVISICKSFKMKLIEGYLETMKYSYSSLAGTTFLFLTCIKMNNHFFWKYNAEVECLSYWQYGVIGFAAIYTIPFSITTILGATLLQKRNIGYTQFMIACLFPLPFLIYWIITFILLQPTIEQKTLKSLVASTKNILDIGTDKEMLSDESDVIIKTFQGPYKDENASWEGVIELRKLFFSTYYLLSNNIYRLVLCTFTAVVTLVHHIFTRPFKNKNSNRAESLSLSLLCMACVTNSIKTVFTESGILVEANTPTEELIPYE